MLKRSLILFFPCLLLTGCGIKGPLYLPPNPNDSYLSRIGQQINEMTGEDTVALGPRVVVTSGYADDGQTRAYRLYGPGTETGGTVVEDAQWDVSRVEARWLRVQRDPTAATAMALISLERTPNDGLVAGSLQVALLEWKAARPIKERAAGTVFIPH